MSATKQHVNALYKNIKIKAKLVECVKKDSKENSLEEGENHVACGSRRARVLLESKGYLHEKPEITFSSQEQIPIFNTTGQVTVVQGAYTLKPGPQKNKVLTGAKVGVRLVDLDLVNRTAEVSVFAEHNKLNSEETVARLNGDKFFINPYPRLITRMMTARAKVALEQFEVLSGDVWYAGPKVEGEMQQPLPEEARLWLEIKVEIPNPLN